MVSLQVRLVNDYKYKKLCHSAIQSSRFSDQQHVRHREREGDNFMTYLKLCCWLSPLASNKADRITLRLMLVTGYLAELTSASRWP